MDVFGVRRVEARQGCVSLFCCETRSLIPARVSRDGARDALGLVAASGWKHGTPADKGELAGGLFQKETRSPMMQCVRLFGRWLSPAYEKRNEHAFKPAPESGSPQEK